MTDPYDPNPMPDYRPVEQQYYPPQYQQQYPPQYPQQFSPPNFLLPPAPAPYPGYPGYPGYPPVDQRPGVTVAAAVLAFIGGGPLITSGLLLMMGASFVNAMSTDLSSQDHNAIVWLGIAGAANLITAALAIIGAILLLTRNPAGRALVTVAAAIDTICAISWMTQGLSGGSAPLVLLLTVPLLVATTLSWQRPVTAWLEAGQVRSPR
jgi:hypothetical protein